MRFRFLVTVFVVQAFVYGCASQTKTVMHGRLITDNVTISAEDNSFTISSGQVFSPPFQQDTAMAKYQTGSEDMVDAYKDAYEKYGAKKVRIKIDGIQTEFYGILSFSKIYDDGKGPATRSYQIQIPSIYVEAAKGGRIAVVYELYKRKKSGQAKSWVLWLSDMPFDV